MDAKKCDRCGAFYMPEGYEIGDIFPDIYIPETKAEAKIIKIVDFCPECKMALQKWMKMEGDSE